MQSGFGLLESGSVSQKNEVNIMVKNAFDVLFGGISYWMFGYGLSFGTDPGSNPFVGVGHFFVDPGGSYTDLGDLFSHFFFHAAFATTATTIVSGAMAERIKLETYIIFSFLNTVIYCFPAHWVWGNGGWLKEMGVVDIAGSSTVHMVGGFTGLVATLMLKPRTGRFVEGGEAPPMGSPTNAIFGLFMLWWGWLGFNCGSTYGVSSTKWILAARSAVATITASIGGGFSAILLSYVSKRKKFDITYIINGVLGALVSISALCALAKPWQGLIIGMIGAVIACLGCELTEKLRIDDPVGVVPVHALSAIWGLLAVGIFGEEELVEEFNMNKGLVAGGGWYLLGVQALACVTIIGWTMVTSFIFLILLDFTIGLRVPLHEEMLGADIVEHSLNGSYDKRSGEWHDQQGNLLTVIKKGETKEYYDDLIREINERLRRGDLPSTSVKKSAFGFKRRDTDDWEAYAQQQQEEEDGDHVRRSSSPPGANSPRVNGRNHDNDIEASDQDSDFRRHRSDNSSNTLKRRRGGSATSNGTMQGAHRKNGDIPRSPTPSHEAGITGVILNADGMAIGGIATRDRDRHIMDSITETHDHDSNNEHTRGNYRRSASNETE